MFYEMQITDSLVIVGHGFLMGLILQNFVALMIFRGPFLCPQALFHKKVKRIKGKCHAVFD